MKDYIYKATIQQLVAKLLAGLEINRDYVIAGGFVRDSLLGLEPKDIDVFIDNKAFPSPLDFELYVSENGGHFKQTGTVSQYTTSQPMPTLTIEDEFAPVVEARLDQAIRARNGSVLYNPMTVTMKGEEPSRPNLQMGREIHCTYDVLYESIFFTVNFIFTTIDKGFTPENLVDTFDCNLVQAYIDKDLNLVPHKTFEESLKTTTAIIYTGATKDETNKSVERFAKWAGRSRATMGWRFEEKNRYITTVDRVKKYIADGPYKSFINRNGKPSKNEQLKTYASAMPMR